jgi:branched-chain amino acid transport system ATP-binding protein
MLRVRDLTVWYHKASVLMDVTLDVADGAFVAIVGSNGSGKTTLLRSILNLHENKGGAIEFLGRDITRQPTHRIVQQGISYVPDYRGILKTLTVRENLQTARRCYVGGREFAAELERIMELIPNLRKLQGRLAGLLSGGEQQMLAIARALLYRPQLLLVDEPSIGLAPLLVREIFRQLRQLTARGMAVLMVEQNVVRTLEASDYCYVLEKGRVLLQGESRALAAREDLKERYWGIH